MTTETVVHPALECECCKQVIPLDADGCFERCVRITRGDFGIDMDMEGLEWDRDMENVKFECFVCSLCFLTDPDLCAFFNKLGLRVR